MLNQYILLTELFNNIKKIKTVQSLKFDKNINKKHQAFRAIHITTTYSDLEHTCRLSVPSYSKNRGQFSKRSKEEVEAGVEAAKGGSKQRKEMKRWSRRSKSGEMKQKEERTSKRD